MKTMKRNLFNTTFPFNRFNPQFVMTSLIAPILFLILMFSLPVNHLNVFLIIGLTGLVWLILYVEMTRYSVWTHAMSISYSFMAAGLLLIMFTVETMSNNLPFLYYATPIAAFSIITKYFIHERFALVSSVFIAIFGSLIFGADDGQVVNFFLYFIISQWFAIFMFQSIKDRKSLIKTATSLLSVHLILVIGFELQSLSTFMTKDFLMAIIFTILSVLFSVILTLGLLPLFEAGFNMLTESKLLTLSNPNHPLLRKLLVEAPGTYQHSVMVANLSESACEAIGANGLLARVAAYYHDVGKALKPHMFIENQNHNSNPHDSLPPEDSARIILQHPHDSARLLKDYRLPKEIVEIAEQHHGTTLLKYFYHKAKDRQKGVKEHNYRYSGPKPQTKEAAVINICDSVEAAVRSKNEPTNEEIKQIVRTIIYDRLMDGQLNDCDLTLNEIFLIEKDICDMLNGIFHARIEYPKDNLVHSPSR